MTRGPAYHAPEALIVALDDALERGEPLADDVRITLAAWLHDIVALSTGEAVPLGRSTMHLLMYALEQPATSIAGGAARRVLLLAGARGVPLSRDLLAECVEEGAVVLLAREAFKLGRRQ